jgi:hypothetical protein
VNRVVRLKRQHEEGKYLIAPFKTAAARIAIPGLGDRIFFGDTG